MKRRHTTMVAVLALAAAAAGGAGIAGSTSTEPIPDANGVIHACYKKPIGPVRIVFSAANCARGEAPLEWNRSGPPGPQGEPGSPGLGTEVIEASYGAAGAPFLDDTPAGKVVLSLDLPEAGTYWVTAKGELNTGSTGISFATCRLIASGDQVDVTHQYRFDDTGVFEQAQFVLLRALEVAAVGPVDVLCSRIGDREIQVTNVRITAFRIA